MSNRGDGQDRWGTTRQIEVIKEAVEGALEGSASQQTQDIAEAKLPLRLVVGIVAFVVTQVISVTAIYYDLRGEVREVSALQSVPSVELAEIKLRLDQAEKDLERLDTELDQQPRTLDNMQKIGELNADIRELKARVNAIESRGR